MAIQWVLTFWWDDQLQLRMCTIPEVWSVWLRCPEWEVIQLRVKPRVALSPKGVVNDARSVHIRDLHSLTHALCMGNWHSLSQQTLQGLFSNKLVPHGKVCPEISPLRWFLGYSHSNKSPLSLFPFHPSIASNFDIYCSPRYSWAITMFMHSALFTVYCCFPFLSPFHYCNSTASVIKGCYLTPPSHSLDLRDFPRIYPWHLFSQLHVLAQSI